MEIGKTSLIVEVRGNFESALSRFGKRVVESGLFRELRNRSRFESRTERRKRKDHEALVRRRKRARFLEGKRTEERLPWRKLGR